MHAYPQITYLHHSNFQAMPWSNGQGKTLEVCRYPAADVAKEFDWRISIASVNSSGPFSTLPDIDRSIMLLTGPAMRLSHGKQGTAEADHILETLKPYTFSGELETNCEIISPTTDFNVMTRRGVCKHSLQVLTLSNSQTRDLDLAAKLQWELVYVVSGSLRLQAGQDRRSYEVAAGDALLIDLRMLQQRPLTIRFENAAHLADLNVLLVDLEPQKNPGSS